MNAPKYNIGQQVYVALAKWEGTYQPCPECGATGTWEVKTATSTFKVACGMCAPFSYEARGPGRIENWCWQPEVLPLGIVSIDAQIEDGTAEYTYKNWGKESGGGSLWHEHQCHETYEAAHAAALVLCEENAARAKATFFERYNRTRKETPRSLPHKVRKVADLERELAKAREALEYQRVTPSVKETADENNTRVC